MACSVAGITSDANVLTNQLRLFSQRHLLHYGEPIPCEQLVASLCDIKQAYTQFGGVYGTLILYSMSYCTISISEQSLTSYSTQSVISWQSVTCTIMPFILILKPRPEYFCAIIYTKLFASYCRLLPVFPLSWQNRDSKHLPSAADKSLSQGYF